MTAKRCPDCPDGDGPGRDVNLVVAMLKSSAHGIMFGEICDKLPSGVLYRIPRTAEALKTLTLAETVVRSGSGRYKLASGVPSPKTGR